MELATELGRHFAANSPQEIRTRLADHRFHWTPPLVVVIGRGLWRFLGFLPGIVVLCLLNLRLRRLAPLILAHWSMDIIANLMTLQS